MMTDHIIHVTEADFEYEVIAFSRQKPVVVDFWADWCAPCKTLGPILEHLADEAQGAFRLAKLDVDGNPNLAIRFSVRSIPNVKAFRDGEVIAEFLGTQPEPRVREFLRNLAPSQADLLLEKGQSQLESLAWEAAEDTFRQLLAKLPNQPGALLGMMKALLMNGRITEAAKMLKEFPTSKEYASAEVLRPLIEALQRTSNTSSDTDNPLEAAYQNSLRLIKRNNLPAAIDGILDVLRQDKRYRDGELRKVILALFEVMGANSQLTGQYRRELAVILF